MLLTSEFIPMFSKENIEMKNKNRYCIYHRAKGRLSYCPDTGIFRWLENSKKVKAGDVAGGLDADGYVVISVNGQPIKAHRLAWFWVKGFIPKETIDHINRIRSDNRIANLREATRLEQRHNVGLTTRNTSGHAGVFWSKNNKKWQAQICIKGKRFHVGLFESLSDAVEKRSQMKNELMKKHGIFQ